MAVDALPLATLAGLAGASAGSTRGFDELVPSRVDVVHESRQYTTDRRSKHGLANVRAALNRLHVILGSNGFDEVSLSQHDSAVVLRRSCAASGESYIAIVHQALGPRDWGRPYGLATVRVNGRVDEVVLAATLEVDGAGFKPCADRINGLNSSLWLLSKACVYMHVHTHVHAHVCTHIHAHVCTHVCTTCLYPRLPQG